MSQTNTYSIRRKYTDGGDFWIVDADTESEARKIAQGMSVNAPLACMYVLHVMRVGTWSRSKIIASYSCGCPSDHRWFVPGGLPVKKLKNPCTEIIVPMFPEGDSVA